MQTTKKPLVSILMYGLFLIHAALYYITYVHKSVLLLGAGVLVYFLVFVLFGTAAFVLVYTNSQKKTPQLNNMTEVTGFVTTINTGFLIISLVFNSLYVRKTIETYIVDMNSHLFISSILINCVFIACYLALVTYAQKEEVRVAKASIVSENKAGFGALVAKRLANLADKVEDSKAKQGIICAKEMVMYSSDKVVGKGYEDEILAYLEHLEISVDVGNPEIIMDDTKMFEQAWHKAMG